MRKRISELISEFKRKSSLQKWIDEQKTIAKDLAYEHRSCVYKNELKAELGKLDCITTLWEKFKQLRKKSTDYDAILTIDKKGYIEINLYFPISQNEWEKSLARYTEKKEKIGKGYAFLVRMNECVYDACHERVEKTFGGFGMLHYNSYESVGSVFIRRVYFSGLY